VVRRLLGDKSTVGEDASGDASRPAEPD